MAKYQAPEGYVLDPNTGLYYTQVIAEDDKGAKSKVVTWFNADTGEYRQDVYPIDGSVVQASESVTSGLKPAPPEPELKITPIKGRAPLAGGPVVATGPVGKVSIDVLGLKQVVGSKSTGAGNKKGLKVAGIVIAAVVVLALAGVGIWKFVLNRDVFGINSDIQSKNDTQDSTSETSGSSDSNTSNDSLKTASSYDSSQDIFDLCIYSSTEMELVFHADRAPEGNGRLPEFAGMNFLPYNMIYNASDYYEEPLFCLTKQNDQPNEDGTTDFHKIKDSKDYWIEGNDLHLHMDVPDNLNLFEYSGEITFLYGYSEGDDFRITSNWRNYAGDITPAESDYVTEEVYTDSDDYDKDSLDYAVKEEGQIIPNGEEYGPNGYWIGCIYGTFLASPQTDFDNDYFDSEIWPCLRLYENGTYELDSSLGGDYWTSRGTYSYIDPKSEMDDIIVTLFDCSRGPGGGTGNAVVVFSDASDYPQFLSDGFGYMGENGAPYWFHREGY
jgi:hypothetical protein